MFLLSCLVSIMTSVLALRWAQHTDEEGLLLPMLG